MMRSSRPWTTSKPAVLFDQTAETRRWFRLRRSWLMSWIAMSDTSKIDTGRGSFLFSRTVLSSPGRSDVRTTWYSTVFGLASVMARSLGSARLRNEKFSSCEHCRTTQQRRAHTHQ